MVKSLSVVLPAYNEEANVKKAVTNVYAVLKKLKLDWEIIVVNDGSKDKTGEIAKSLQKTVPHLSVIENKPNRGYGGALKRGFSESRKQFIAFVPADNQFDFGEITKLLAKQEEEDADIVSGIRVQDSDPPHRRFFRWGWNSMVRAIFGFLASDVDCGFKLLRREILSKVSLPSNGAMVDTQLFAGARARGMKVAEIPVTHLPRTHGKSTGGNPKVILKALKELSIFWWQLKQEILVEQGRAVFRWEAIFILFILILAAILRLYQIDRYLTFLGDEGRDVNVVRRMITELHPALIGPQTSIGNMYLGPLYYYLMFFPLLVFNFNPTGPAVMVALIGLATIGLLWWIVRQWCGRIPALAVAFLYSISPTVIIHSRSSWNPNIMPFFALLTIYGIWKVWRFGYWRWVIFTGVSFAFVLQSHYLGLLLIPPAIIFLLLAPKPAGYQKRLGLAITLFLILMSPLLFFDILHGWPNSQAMFKFFSVRQETVNFRPYKAIPNVWPLWVSANTTLLAANNYILGIIASTSLLLGAIYAYLKRNSRRELIFLLTWLLFGLIGLGLYKQHIYDHYYGFIFTLPFILLAFFIRSTKYLSLLLMIPLIVASLTANPLQKRPNDLLGRTKRIAEFIKTQSADQKFNLALIAKRNYDAGYRYFLDLNQASVVKVENEIASQLFVVCEDPICEPINHPLAEIARFGWSKIDAVWEIEGIKVFKLIHNI